MSELAEIIDEKPVGVIKFLMTDLGIMASMTQSLDPATCAAVVEGFGKIVSGGFEDMDEDLFDEESALETGVVLDGDDDPADLKPRAPVVTIMGHGMFISLRYQACQSVPLMLISSPTPLSNAFSSFCS